MDEGDNDKSWDDIDAGWGDLEGAGGSAPEDKSEKKKHSWMSGKSEEPPSADESARPTLQAIEAVAPETEADRQPIPEDDPDDAALEEAESEEPTRPGHEEVDLMAQPIQFEEHKPEDEEQPRERHTRDTARLKRISDSVVPVASDAGSEAFTAEESEPLVVRPPAAANIPSPQEPAAAQPKGDSGSRQALIIFVVLVVLAVAAVAAVVVTALG
jgi:hypothetical protein